MYDLLVIYKLNTPYVFLLQRYKAMNKYFKGSGAEHLDVEFEKLLSVIQAVGSSSMQSLHAKAGAIGGLYFLMAFAKENNIATLQLAEVMKEMAETNVRNLFEQMWVHKDRSVTRMKGRFLCDIAVGYNHMLDLYKKRYPTVGHPGAVFLTDNDNSVKECKTGANLFKTLTSKIPAPK